MSSQSPSSIRAQLAKIVKSQTFAGTERLRRFLTFIVEQTLEFPNESLKEIIIGNELYAGDEGFDPRLSAVVRVDATRLRSKLREYYASEGATDSLTIDLPKGRYSPVFRALSIRTDHAGNDSHPQTNPSIAVLLQ